MRILVLSDLHYRLPHYDWLLGAAAQVDAVAIVGDLADVVSPVPHDVQAVVVVEYLERLAALTTVLVASGNHDLDGPGVHGSAGPPCAQSRAAGSGDRCRLTAPARCPSRPLGTRGQLTGGDGLRSMGRRRGSVSRRSGSSAADLGRCSGPASAPYRGGTAPPSRGDDDHV